MRRALLVVTLVTCACALARADVAHDKVRADKLFEDGRRYLKTIIQGKTRGVATLTSWNARPIRNVKLEWIGEIYLVIRADQIGRIRTRKVPRTKRR